jgi:Mrp family chromosome partitioning ATPase/capsular polysaccharide biosynthesis protein
VSPAVDGGQNGGDVWAGGSRTLRGYVDVLKKRRRLILEFTILVPVIAVALSLLQTKQYQATALVEISRQDLAATLTGTPNTSELGTDFSRVAQTDATVAMSPTVAAAALSASGIRGNPQALLDAASVTSSPTTDLLTFRVADENPQMAQRLVNAFASAYTAYQARLDTAALEQAQQGVAAQIAKLKSSGSQVDPSLVSRQSELQVLQALQSSNTSVVRSANSAAKLRPRPVRNAIAGLFIGLLLGIVAAFVAEALDSRVGDEEEVAGQLDRPILSRLPTPPRRARTAGTAVTLADPHGPDAEAFRILRANLNTIAQREKQTLIVTSALPAEGKTTTCANLAIALARGGARVTVVDLDLRKPTMGKLFSLPADHPGITNVVLGGVDLADALVTVPIDGGGGAPGAARPLVMGDGSLQVLPSGPTPPSVGELVSSDLLTPVIASLRESCDVVLIDTPPLLGVGDVTALAHHADGVLLVVRLGLATRKVLSQLRQVMSRLPTDVIGIAVTGGEARDGYGYGYGYGYRGTNSGSSFDDLSQSVPQAPAATQ